MQELLGLDLNESLRRGHVAVNIFKHRIFYLVLIQRLGRDLNESIFETFHKKSPNLMSFKKTKPSVDAECATPRGRDAGSGSCPLLYMPPPCPPSSEPDCPRQSSKRGTTARDIGALTSGPPCSFKVVRSVARLLCIETQLCHPPSVVTGTLLGLLYASVPHL